MDILNSDWLIHTLKKIAGTPQMRLLSLFDILDQWCEAPGIRESINLYLPQPESPEAKSNALQQFLSIESAKAGAEQPEMLGMQLYYIAQSALIEKIAGNHIDGLQHAKNAAKALIKAQTNTEFRIAKKPVYASAASLFLACLLGGIVNFYPQHSASHSTKSVSTDSSPITTVGYDNSNAEKTAALIAQIEQMRSGSCHYPEALQLPDNLKGVYLDTVVNGRISTNPHEQELAMALIKTIQCNYTPMLMANSR